MMLLKVSKPLVPIIWLISLVMVECKKVRVKNYDNITTIYNITNNNTISNYLVQPNNTADYNLTIDNTIGALGIELEYVPIFDSSSLMIKRGLQSRNTQEASSNSLPDPTKNPQINKLATNIFGQFFLHSTNSINELAASFQASAQGNYPVSAGQLSGSAEGLFASETKSSENTLSWTGFFSWATAYEWDVNQWKEMTSFINSLDITMTKAQFVQRYGRYVPNGFSLGCTVKHQISVSCRTAETTSKFETTLKASLKGSSYNADFAANLKGVIGNNNNECSFAGSAQIIGPTNLLSTPLITSIDDIQTLMNDVKNMPSRCANTDQRNLGFVRVRYMPWTFVDKLPNKWKSDVGQDDPKNVAVHSDFLKIKSLIQANEKYESDISYRMFKKLRFYNRFNDPFEYRIPASWARWDYQRNWSKFTNEVIKTNDLKIIYDNLYDSYKTNIKPERYEIEVQQNLGFNRYRTHNFNMKGPRIIVDENDNDKIYIADGKCLKTSVWFWQCYDFKATVDFTKNAPIFTVERWFEGKFDGKTEVNLSYISAINTPWADDQFFPSGMKCYKGDSWCFISAPKDDWFFIRIRPV